MPHRRKIKKGSFDGHFDELVKQFVHPSKREAPSKPAKSGRARKSIHQALFERAAH
jgi:hypothetical protein